MNYRGIMNLKWTKIVHGGNCVNLFSTMKPTSMGRACKEEHLSLKKYGDFLDAIISKDKQKVEELMEQLSW